MNAPGPSGAAMVPAARQAAGRPSGLEGPPTQESYPGLPLRPDDTGNFGAVPAGEGTAAFSTIFDGYEDAQFPGTTYSDASYGDDAGGGPPAADRSHLAGAYDDDGYVDEDFYDDTYDEADEEGRRGLGRLAVIVLIVLVVLLAPLLIGGFWVMRQINPGNPGDPVEVTLEGGMTTSEIGELLHEHGVTGDPRVFGFYARFQGAGDIQAGTYQNLHENMSMGDALDVLAEGPDVGGGSANILPGQTVDELMTVLGETEEFDEDELHSALEEVEFPLLPEGTENPEGLLASGSYELDPGLTELEFLQLMSDRFTEVYGDLGVEAGAAELDIGEGVTLSGYEVVIVASLIEREALVEEDRPMVARVIYNRLAQERHLQIDATTCYIAETDPCELTTELLESDSPYNTRNRDGLPPTPIAIPSEASLEAAVNPAEGTWDHYVLDAEADDGSHFFTDDDDEFIAARDRCREAGLCAYDG